MRKGWWRSCLAAVCLLALWGCGTQPVTSDPSPAVSDPAPEAPAQKLTSFAIAYSKEDTLNPFKTKTEANLQLATLLYDSLTVVGDGFQSRCSLASSVTFTDPTHLVATLRKEAVFSDGTPVTVGDVTASYYQAKDSKNYKVLLQNVKAVSADSTAGTVTFTLSAADPHAQACLSFPVVKGSTLTAEVGKAPLGGGLYTLQTDEDGARLTANPRSGKTPHFDTVGLRHLPNAESMYYGLSSGEITYYYDDLNGGSVPRVTGANVAVDMNALLFLGVNTGHEALSQPVVRTALSALLDRVVLANAAYSGWATASAQPFHPAWAPMAALDMTAPVRDLEAAVDGLKEAGYSTDKKPLTLELLYCTDNASRGTAAELIRSQCEGAGVTVTMVPLAYDEYMARLKAGKFDLYLGEVRLAANMSLRPLLAGGSAGYGGDKKSPAATAYKAYLAGESTLPEFLEAFSADMPFIPLCWRSGFAAYDRRLTTATPTGYDPYAGFADWK